MWTRKMYIYALKVTFSIFYNLCVAYQCTGKKSQIHICRTNSNLYLFVKVESFASGTIVDIRVLKLSTFSPEVLPEIV